MIEAVIFDIGNVLIRWAPDGFYDRVIGADRRRAFFDAVPIHDMNLRVDAGADIANETRALADAYPDWADEILMWHDRWLEMLPGAIDGSVDLLRALRRSGLPVYALSNFGKDTFTLAEQHFPFLEEFDGRFISGRMGVIKPDSAIYEAVEAGVDHAPDRLLFTDDSLPNIQAAAARGWQVHHFDGAEGLRQRLSDEGLI